MADMQRVFSGEELYGDDFTLEQIQEWYDQEAEAYAQMYGVYADIGTFNHPISMYAYKYLKKIVSFDRALGIGASWGYEFLPIINRIKNLDIIESSTQTVSEKLGQLVPIYHIVNTSGKIDFQDDTFDLVNILSTLHHIPNVSYVLNEAFRVLKHGGYMLLREPVTSMGDWREKRLGLTVNERGIPPKIFDKIITDAGMQIVHKHYFGSMTPFFIRLTNNHRFFRSKTYFIIDKYLSKLLRFNMHYHPTNKRQRIAPQYVFYVLKKK